MVDNGRFLFLFVILLLELLHWRLHGLLAYCRLPWVSIEGTIFIIFFIVFALVLGFLRFLDP